MKEKNKKRYHLKVMGIVQGVGYRPYVYNTAAKFNIKGWVSNQGSALVVDFEGEGNNIKEFLKKIIKEPPELANIEKVEVTSKKLTGHKGFNIVKSSSGKNETKFVARDVATCPECLSDILDPLNSRYGYAFTNCTSCGPRYSIIKGLPYDRVNTTMESFKMCPSCRKEYSDPVNRRFHAQPNCCPKCGPYLKLLDLKGKDLSSENPIKETINLIKDGKIVAIKGLGGFHLACKVENENAIQVLRKRKNRPHKPFAIMVKDIETAHKLAYISREEERILSSNRAPIVILDKKKYCILPDILSPNTRKIGIMLPYTPLHHLLFQGDISILVMTSGNFSGGPIQYENKKAINSLGNICDYFLIHNRDINISMEDSVVKVIGGNEVVIRRARGYTPYSINMNINDEMIALGAEEKSSFAFSKRGYGHMSQYLGDLKNFDAYNTYKNTIENLKNLIEVKPKTMAYDLNWRLPLPNVSENKLEKIPVQHHHAHMVSCMVEHDLCETVIAIIFDGTGLGTDRTIWGGEFLLGDRQQFTRVGHLKKITIQGGDYAIRQPWRIALSYLYSINQDINKRLKGIDRDQINTVKQALEKGINCYETSSMGRLFDCVAALLNIRNFITYDGQGAIELENIIDKSVDKHYDFNINKEDDMFQIEYRSIIFGILEDIDMGIASSIISTKFHNTIVKVTVDLTHRISEIYGIRKVVLSGGVFQNNYLLLNLLEKLKERKLEVYYNQQIPTNDNGISVGQLAIVDALKRKV